jgi:non-canonical (house-cleaning) NTP pyrophosphatase
LSKKVEKMTKNLLIAVGSTNSAKINAVKRAIDKIGMNVPGFEHASVLGIDSPSRVSNQPMSEDETIQGFKV